MNLKGRPLNYKQVLKREKLLGEGMTVTIVRWPTWPTTDPNDSYRKWLEKHVGIQGVDWDWGMADTPNRLYIWTKYPEFLSILKLM